MILGRNLANKRSQQDVEFWDLPLAELLEQLKTSPQGLSSEEADRRLQEYGPNELIRESPFATFTGFLRFFANPLVLILFIAAIVSLLLGEHVSALIIITIVLVSVVLNFAQEYRATRAVRKLRQQVSISASVVRDGKERDLPIAYLVPGDIVKLNAGDLVPADCRLLEAKDLNVRESALTGESLPVEKVAVDLKDGPHSLPDAQNSVFFGTSVQTGIGTAVVVRTGSSTALGDIALRLAQRPPETEFDRGVRQFGLMVTRIVMLLVLFVFMVNVFLVRPMLDSFLFAVALAVGLTPELLPVIVSVTLAQGARRMAGKKVIVKQLAAIENFGSMDILCCDKSGTLTEGDIVLYKYVNVQGEDDEEVIRAAYLNSFFQSGITSPLDKAILSYREYDVRDYKKIDEIPFDFARKRLSVVVQRGEECLLVTKGDVESVVGVCTGVKTNNVLVPLGPDQRAAAENLYRRLSEEGYRVLAVAIRPVTLQQIYKPADEVDMTLLGFIAFSDPPKEGVAQTLKALQDDGISVLVMSGDNQFVTRKIAGEVGLPIDRLITGSQVDMMDDSALAYQAEQGAIFARVTPEQKNRIILALKSRGHVVGFLGDGINDAPSLHAADVGVSVVNGVDVAKEAASIILLEKDLGVLHEGVIEGRQSFANIMKYIMMGTSSNFGNMFSMAVASLFLPFLPMLPTQILLNNLLYDFSQMSIPTDNVDAFLLQKPRRWNIRMIWHFMVLMGPISSVYDFITFWVLLSIFKAGEILFHTGWFVESLATQTLVIFVIRTAGSPLKSRPSIPLLVTVLTVVAVAVYIPNSSLGRLIGFAPVPTSLLLTIAVLTISYLLLVEIVKRWFYRHYLGV
jgi:Mg2+-importing ATPase